MIIVYDSRTGNVARFVKKLDFPTVKLESGLLIHEPFVLVTYTTGMGKVPPNTLAFLKENHQEMIGVAASGNRNWGDNFAKSADIISDNYEVPVVSKFELFGTSKELEHFYEGVMKLETRFVK